MIRAAVQRSRTNFSLDVEFQSQTAATGVFGPSGAGKTTLINMIAGLERPDRGSIMLNGQTLFDSEAGIDVPPHRRRIGVVFQEHRLFPHYSVTGNLAYGCRRGRGELQRIADLLELTPLLSRRVHELSGGERQRVALGRALLSDPQLLMLDEPFASLDQRLRQQIIPYLRRVRDVLGLPMLLVSHDLTEILQLTDRILVLDRGRVMGHGRYVDLVHDQAVRSVVHDRGMTNVLTALVRSSDPSDGSSILVIGMCPLIAPLASAAAGSNVTVSVQPWDIALAMEPIRGVSIQNQIRGTVRRCTTHERSMMVEIDIGAPLLVEISRRSAASLDVQLGHSIICLIKSQAIRYVDSP